MSADRRLPARRRALVQLAAGVAAGTAAPLVNAATERTSGRRPGVLRYAFLIAETGFDPAQISDNYSRCVTANIFESPLRYDHFARPYKLRTCTAAAMPEMSADNRACIVKIRPGIFFADDPAFKGVKRELVAQDYVYSFKRFLDPTNKSPMFSSVMDLNFTGAADLHKATEGGKKPFNYEREIDGIRAPDRYTLQFKFDEPSPRFLYYALAVPDLFGAVAREVIEFYPGKTMEHPIGTGPYRLAEWRRSSRIVLEKNPNFREEMYDAEPNEDDVEGRAVVAKLRGRRLPLNDRVEIDIIEESQPRWLAFVGGEHDLIDRVPPEFINIAVPNGELAPNLAQRGVKKYQVLAADVTITLFNIDHPVIGGMTPEKVALRRAISLGYDTGAEIRGVRRGQAIVAQSPIAPNTSAYDSQLRTENGDYDPRRAMALLDLFGYVDRDGDGWREMPDGTPLTLEMNTEPDQLSRQFDEGWKKNMAAIGLRMNFKTAKWPENLKQVRVGKHMMWRVGSTMQVPDSWDVLDRAYGPAAGQQNYCFFRNAEYDRLYVELRSLIDGPERLERFRAAVKILTAYMPMKYNVHRILTDLTHPWVIGYRRPPFSLGWWAYVAVEDAAA